MKEILRRLLQAEEAGRKAAAVLEERGEEFLCAAKAESEQIVRRIRSDAQTETEKLERQAQDETLHGRQAIAREADATIERMKSQTVKRRSEAVARIIKLLLDE